MRFTVVFAACIATTAMGLCGTALSPAGRAATPASPGAVADGGVMVHQAWARASAGAATTGAAYVTLMGGAHPDALVGVSTPIAGMAEVHETINDNGVMKMRSIAVLPVPAHQMVTFAPGGYHIMLMGLKQTLVAGQAFPLTLRFAHSAPVTVDVKVQDLRGSPGMHDHH